MKQRIVFLCCALALLAAVCVSEPRNTYRHALERAEAYAYAINHDYRQPEKIYGFLTQELKSCLTEEEFCACWEKERTYPYITPLYIFDPELTLSEDGAAADVTFRRAARLIGMEYTVRMVYENGDYYADDWHQFVDGSYLEKFEDIPYQIEWYYNIEDIRP